MGPDGSHGLQIHSWVVVSARVGSIPTRSRQFLNLILYIRRWLQWQTRK